MSAHTPDDAQGINYLTWFTFWILVKAKKPATIHNVLDNSKPSNKWTLLVLTWFLIVPPSWLYFLSARSPSMKNCKLCLIMPWEPEDLIAQAEMFWGTPPVIFFPVLLVLLYALQLVTLGIVFVLASKFEFSLRATIWALLIGLIALASSLMLSAPQIAPIQWLITVSIPSIFGFLIALEIFFSYSDQVKKYQKYSAQ